MIVSSYYSPLEKRQRLFEHLLRCQHVGVDVEVCMVPGVVQTVGHFGPPACLRVGGPTLTGDLPGDVQVYEQVGLRDALPHRRHVGMFLRYLAGVVPPLP